VSPESANSCKFRLSRTEPDPPQFQGPILYSCTGRCEHAGSSDMLQSLQKAANTSSMSERDGLTLLSRSCSEMPDCQTRTATITQWQTWLSLIFSDNLTSSEDVAASSPLAPCQKDAG